MGAWSLAWRGKGSRRGRGTRREHRNRAALLWNRLNQRSHIVSSLDLETGFHECPGRRNLDKATRGGDGAETVRVKIGRKRNNGVLDKELSVECHRRILGSGIQVESGRQKKGVLSIFLFFPFHFPFRVRGEGMASQGEDRGSIPVLSNMNYNGTRIKKKDDG